MAKSGSCWEAYLQIKRAEYTPDWLIEYSFLNKVGFFKRWEREGQFINRRQRKSHLLNSL